MLPVAEDGVGGGGDAGGGSPGGAGKVRKMEFKFASNLPIKELTEVSDGAGKAAPVPARAPEVEVPVM